jgi:hypothetical protein
MDDRFEIALELRRQTGRVLRRFDRRRSRTHEQGGGRTKHETTERQTLRMEQTFDSVRVHN